jgi:hypothetical protein
MDYVALSQKELNEIVDMSEIKDSMFKLGTKELFSKEKAQKLNNEGYYIFSISANILNEINEVEKKYIENINGDYRDYSNAGGFSKKDYEYELELSEKAEDILSQFILKNFNNDNDEENKKNNITLLDIVLKNEKINFSELLKEKKIQNAEIVNIDNFKVFISNENFLSMNETIFKETNADIIIERNKLFSEQTNIIKNTNKFESNDFNLENIFKKYDKDCINIVGTKTTVNTPIDKVNPKEVLELAANLSNNMEINTKLKM